MLVQCIPNDFNDGNNSRQNTQTKYKNCRKRTEIQVQKVFDGGDNRNVNAENQQQRRTGNARQYHRTNCNCSADKDIQECSNIRMRQADVCTIAGRGQISNHGNHCNANQNKENPADLLFQALFLFQDDHWNGEKNKAHKQRGNQVDVTFKDVCQYQNR